MLDDHKWKKQDKFYHEDREIVDTFDKRIIRKYQVEHKYFTLNKWIEALKVNKAQQVLDFGCATGTSSLALSRNGIKAVALDASTQMIEKVRKKAQAENLTVRCVVGDAEQLPFKNNCFDGVICMGVLHHLPNMTKGIEEQIRVLNETGMIFITEPFAHRAWISYPYHFCLEFIRRVINLGKKNNLCTPERLLNDTDLNNIKTLLDKHHLKYQIKYFVYWTNIIGFMPEFVGYPLVCFLNMLNGLSNRGDIIFICITKAV